MNKSSLYGIILVAIVVIVGGIFLSKKNNNSNQADTNDNVPKVDIQSLILESFENNEIILQLDLGVATIKSGDSEISLASPEKRVVAIGSTIKTQADSGASLFYPNGTIATLGDNTEIVVSEFIDLENAQTSKIKLINGNLWSRVEQVLDKENTYEVETANAVATVRGTSLWTQYVDKKTKLIVDEASKKVLFKTLDPKSGKVLDGGTVEVGVGEATETDTEKPPTLKNPLSVRMILATEKEVPFFKANIKKDDNIKIIINKKENIIRMSEVKPEAKIAPRLVEIASIKIEPKVEPVEDKKEIVPEKKAPVVVTPKVVEPEFKITSLSPMTLTKTSYGFTNRKITITGVGFTSATEVIAGNTILSDLVVVNDTTITANVSDSILPGKYDVSVKKTDKIARLIKGLTVSQSN